MFFSGDHFALAKGGHFTLAEGDHFALAEGASFNWRTGGSLVWFIHWAFALKKLSGMRIQGNIRVGSPSFHYTLTQGKNFRLVVMPVRMGRHSN